MIHGKYCIHSIGDLKGYKILRLNQARSPEGCISRDLCFLSVSLEPPLLPNLRFNVLFSKHVIRNSQRKTGEVLTSVSFCIQFAASYEPHKSN